MDRLWAPWRYTYIRKIEKMKCFLCAYPKQKNDRRSFILKRGRTCFAILNRYPYNTGHLMIAPYAHKKDLDELTPEETQELFALAAEMKGLLEKKIRPHGFNLGINLGRIAGAGLPGHLHLHIVPRWQGDTNFMPVVGRTKVLPLSLEDVYERMCPKRRLKKRRPKRR
ncbi:MAG: HIT family protein [Planctomycetota bacterium]|jgi:ATP adenylyltransferase